MRLRQHDVSWQRFDTDAVLLDLRTSTYFTLNETGADLVDALDRADTDAAALERVLLEAYDVTAERASQDVRALLAELEQRGLLEQQRT